MPIELAARQVQDRQLFRWAALIALAVIFGGFARTYYLKTAFDTPALTPLLHLHGVVMSTWIGLFAAQTWLVATDRTQVHRRLGIVGVFVASAVLVAGTATAIIAARLGHSPGPPPLRFLAVPLADMAQFGILIGAGFYFRSRSDFHKRLMLLATLSIMTPAIARLPISFIQDHKPLMPFGMTDLIILAFIAYDTYKHHRLHPAFGWGGALIFASLPMRLALARTDAWMQFARWVTG